MFVILTVAVMVMVNSELVAKHDSSSSPSSTSLEFEEIESQPTRHCSSPSGSLDGRISVEEDGGALADFTTITWQIGLGETLCYRFKSETTPHLAGSVEVSYRSLKAIYSILDSYHFLLPSAEVKCLCDCPGGGSYCDSGTNLCQNKTNCANYYNPSVQSNGCFFSFLKLSAAMCCSIQVIPATGEKFRAVHLGVPNIIAQFTTVYKNLAGEVLDTRQYNIDLNTGTTIDWDVSIQVSSPGPTTLVPSDWYVVPESLGHRHSVIAGLDVNRLESWDVQKVGWLKAGKGGKVVTSSMDQLMHLFSPEVQSCSEGKYSGSFSKGKINGPDDLGGRSLKETFPFLSEVRVWRRHVEMKHKESPLLSLTLQHRTRVGVVVQYTSSSLEDFTGLLYQDTASHLHLNLTLFQAAGTVTGVVTGGGDMSQSILLRLPMEPTNSSHQVKLTATQCKAGQISVSLRPLSLHNLTITKQLPCISESLRTFRSTGSQTENNRDQVEIKAGSRYDCLSCGAAWLHWLDPDHWLEAGWSQTRAVVVGSMVLLVIIVIILVWRLAMMCCCKCPEKKRYYL